jgi:hypothetical protein
MRLYLTEKNAFDMKNRELYVNQPIDLHLQVKPTDEESISNIDKSTSNINSMPTSNHISGRDDSTIQQNVDTVVSNQRNIPNFKDIEVKDTEGGDESSVYLKTMNSNKDQSF